jgi:hypothetical protein
MDEAAIVFRMYCFGLSNDFFWCIGDEELLARDTEKTVAVELPAC